MMIARKAIDKRAARRHGRKLAIVFDAAYKLANPFYFLP
jgi:hypothetical protein